MYVRLCVAPFFIIKNIKRLFNIRTNDNTVTNIFLLLFNTSLFLNYFIHIIICYEMLLSGVSLPVISRRGTSKRDPNNKIWPLCNDTASNVQSFVVPFSHLVVNQQSCKWHNRTSPHTEEALIWQTRTK